MASTPITAVSYFGAKALNDIYNKNVGPNTAMNITFAAVPWMKPFRAASTATTVQQLNEAGKPVAE